MTVSSPHRIHLALLATALSTTLTACGPDYLVDGGVGAGAPQPNGEAGTSESLTFDSRTFELYVPGGWYLDRGDVDRATRLQDLEYRLIDADAAPPGLYAQSRDDDRARGQYTSAAETGRVLVINIGPLGTCLRSAPPEPYRESVREITGLDGTVRA